MRKVSQDPNVVFEFKACRGVVSHGDESADIEFDLLYARTGEIELSVVKLPLTRTMRFLLAREDEEDLFVVPLSLRAAAPDGTRLASDDIFVASHAINLTSAGETMDLQFQLHDLVITWPSAGSEPKSSEPTHFRYWVQGLLGFSASSVVCGPTKITVAAESKLDDFRVASGFLDVSPAGEGVSQVAVSLPSADRHARRTLDLLSLAEGRFLHWCVRNEYAADRRIRSTVAVREAAPRPKYPVFSHLNLQPVLNLLTSRFTDTLIEKTGIDVAIEWMLMNPYYLEAEFLTLSTALEHLLDRFAKAEPNRRSLLPSAVFENIVRPEIVKSLRDTLGRLGLAAESEEVRGSIEARLGNLNNASLRDLLMKFLRHYSVPVDDIESRIPDLLRLRNRVVHVGQASPDREMNFLLRSVVTLRELLARILLSMIGFRGHYNAYPGQKWTTFPPSSFRNDSAS